MGAELEAWEEENRSENEDSSNTVDEEVDGYAFHMGDIVETKIRVKKQVNPSNVVNVNDIAEGK